MPEVKTAEGVVEPPAQTQAVAPSIPMPEIPMLPPTAHYIRVEDVAPLVPFAVAILCGSLHLIGATIFFTVVGIMAAFAFSSFGLFDWIADIARICCTGGALLVALGFGLNCWPFLIRAMFLLVGTGLLTLGVLRREYWMNVQRAKQAHHDYMAAFRNSDAVDEVLSRMANGSQTAGMAAEQWDDYGCAECRAMIRQGFGQLATEKNLATIGKACYMLGVLHSEARIETAEAAADEAEARAADADELRKRLANLSEELTDLQEAYDKKAEAYDALYRDSAYQGRVEERLKKKLAEAQDDAQAAMDALAASQEEPQDQEMTKEQREAAIVADREAGMSWADLAEKYGMSKGGVRAVIDRHKKEEQEAQEDGAGVEKETGGNALSEGLGGSAG